MWEPAFGSARRIGMNKTPIIAVLSVVAALGLSACGGGASGSPAPAETGTIAVNIEPVEGFFIEGFEVGIRFETPDGVPISSTLWSDFVTSQGEPELEDYYTSVLEETVPAGEVIVLASANVGIGPGPEIPDVDGELRCRLPVTVPANGTVSVEITFSDPDNCLRLN